MRKRIYCKADRVASTMPLGLVHHRKGEPYDILKSEPVQWLIEQPEILAHIFNRFIDKSVVTFDPETKTWGGNPIPPGSLFIGESPKPKQSRMHSDEKILSVLREKGPTRSLDLVALSGLPNGTLYRYLDALESEGKIKKLPKAKGEHLKWAIVEEKGRIL